MFNDLKAEYDASVASQSVVGLKTSTLNGDFFRTTAPRDYHYFA